MVPCESKSRKQVKLAPEAVFLTPLNSLNDVKSIEWRICINGEAYLMQEIRSGNLKPSDLPFYKIFSNLNRTKES